jgi:hypothetical protein
MFKKISKILCLSMSTIFIFANTVTVQAKAISTASNGTKTQIVTDNNLVKIVSVTNGSDIVVATLNKQTQEETITESGKVPITFSVIPKVNNIPMAPASLPSNIIAEHFDSYFGIGYDIYTNHTMDAYADHETNYWKLGMKYGASQQTFETATDNLCTNEVHLLTAVSGATIAACVTALLAAPGTLGTSALLALLLTLGIVVVSITAVYSVYTSYSKAIEDYRLLTGYQS